MLSSSTFIVEMTGILGAGYPPGLFQPLTALLRVEYRMNDHNTLRPVITRYHVDNTGAFKEDVAKHERVRRLTVKVAEDPVSVTEAEWREVVDLLLQAERRFLDDLEAYPQSVDVAFRRGGRLQDHIIFHRAQRILRRIVRDARTTPKLQLFLRADLETIRAAYEDPHLQQLIRENPGVYNATPERAYSQQEAWLERVRRLTGLHHIDRREVSKDAFARHILDELAPLLRVFGVDIRRSNAPHDIFVSYAAQDQDFTRPLADAVSRQGLKVWFDQFELDPGDSLAERLSHGLAKARYGVVVLSPAFLAKPWTSWAKTELAGLLARETSGERVLMPIWLGVSKHDVLGFSPPLADIVALDASVLNVDEIAGRLKRKVTRMI